MSQYQVDMVRNNLYALQTSAHNIVVNEDLDPNIRELGDQMFQASSAMIEILRMLTIQNVPDLNILVNDTIHRVDLLERSQNVTTSKLEKLIEEHVELEETVDLINNQP